MEFDTLWKDTYEYKVGTGGLTTNPFIIMQYPACNILPDCYVEAQLPVGFDFDPLYMTFYLNDDAIPDIYEVEATCSLTYFDFDRS